MLVIIFFITAFLATAIPKKHAEEVDIEHDEKSSAGESKMVSVFPEDILNGEASINNEPGGSVKFASHIDFDEKTSASSRIVGGSPATIAGHPYMASLREVNFHICGGSIVNQRFVLTAAHCVSNLNSNNLQNKVIVVGTNSLTSGGARYAVEQVIHRADYNPRSSRNDVGYIKIRKSFVWNNFVRPITLYRALVGTDVSVHIAGWGRTSTNGQASPILLELDVTTISDAECKRFYGVNVGPGNLCTRSNTGRGTCSGDSGSPLTLNGFQVGINSFIAAKNQYPCGSGYPEGYTRISYYYNDILNTVR